MAARPRRRSRNCRRRAAARSRARLRSACPRSPRRGRGRARPTGARRSAASSPLGRGRLSRAASSTAQLRRGAPAGPGVGRVEGRVPDADPPGVAALGPDDVLHDVVPVPTAAARPRRRVADASRRAGRAPPSPPQQGDLASRLGSGPRLLVGREADAGHAEVGGRVAVAGLDDVEGPRRAERHLPAPPRPRRSAPGSRPGPPVPPPARRSGPPRATSPASPAPWRRAWPTCRSPP